MNTIRNMILGAALLPMLPAAAQQQAKDSTLNRTVVVENQYNPEVMDAFKVNVLPQIEEPAVAKQHIDYAESQRPLTTWAVAPMGPITRSLTQPVAPRGYIRGAYGNRNNTDFKASYLWNISSRDQLGVMASLYGLCGDIPMLTEEDDWKSRFFRTDFSLDYRHDFKRVALWLGGNFASQVFNYMPASTSSAQLPGYLDKQHYTLAEGYVGVRSTDTSFPVRFGIQTGLRSFSRKYAQMGLWEGSENIFHTKGYMEGDISDEQQVGLNLTMDNVIHDVDQQDYTLLRLNPYYTYRNGSFEAHLGAHVDWQTAYHGGIKAAPDIELAYTFATSNRLYLKAGGGTQLNDFRQLNDISPYWFQTEQMRTTYTPMDLSLGLKASPVPGLGLHLYGGYRMVKNEIFVLPGMADENAFYVYAGLAQDKAKLGYGGASVSYAYRDWFDFSVDGAFYGWSVDEGKEALLMLNPAFEIGLSARFKILEGLHAGLSYRYEGRKNIDSLDGKADPVNELNLRADYELMERFNVFVSVNNLLNKTYLQSNGYPMQKLYVMGGVSYRF